MTRFVFPLIIFLSGIPAYAMPQFLQLYRMDPFRNPNMDGCNTCHMSPQGGDARNAFGQAFENAGERITPLLRAQFPDRFVYPMSRAGDSLTIHFSDPDKKQVVLETGGSKNLVDVENRTLNGAAAANGVAAVSSPAPAGGVAQTTSSDIPVDPYAREGAFFGSNVVNLPNGKPQKKGGVDFFVGHRFSQDVSSAGLSGLFGFDSPATVAFGVRAGITDRLSVSLLRTNAAKTISLGAALQISRQGEEIPLTMQLRVSDDGVRNFGLYHRSNNPFPRIHTPVVQMVTTRTFKDRVSFTLIPTFAFNARDESRDTPETAFGADHNNTIAMGIGTGIRVLPTTSLVGEYIPRLWGFRGSLKDRPGVSIGLQKSTFRHTFELLISRQGSMTPAQYSVQGLDTFRVGFNIYRRIR
jgi:hypothetical protein